MVCHQGGVPAVGRARDHGQHDPHRDVLRRRRRLVTQGHHLLREDVLRRGAYPGQVRGPLRDTSY